MPINGKTYPMACTLAAVEYINRTFGGFEGLGKAFSSESQRLTAVMDLTVVFIKQGIAKWKFERGDVDDSDICLDPITREELELTLGIEDVADLAKHITDAVTKGNDKTIKGKPAKGSKKNME